MARITTWGLACVAILVSAAGTDAGLIDFESVGDLANNFRHLEGTAEYAQTDPLVGEPDNDYVGSWTGAAAGTRVSILYDTTAGDGDATKTTFHGAADVSFKSRQTGDRSIGIYVINAANRHQAYLALFNMAAGASDQVRFAWVTDPLSATATNYGTLVGVQGNSGYDPGGDWMPITVAYSTNGSGEPVLSMTAGLLSHTATLTGGTAFPEVELAVRFSPNSGKNVYLDDFLATPEPASLVLVALGGLGLLARRRG